MRHVVRAAFQKAASGGLFLAEAEIAEA